MNSPINKIILFVILSIIFGFFVTGCKEKQQPFDCVFTPPDFSTSIEISPTDEIRISLMLSNSSDSSFPEDQDFQGVMQLWNQNAELRSKIETPIMQMIKAGETITPASADLHLETGVYFLTWSSPKYGGVMYIFAVEEDSGQISIGKTNTFRSKPVEINFNTARVGNIQSFRISENRDLFLSGETPLPENTCVFPLLFNSEGMANGYPCGSCARIIEGRWEMQISNQRYNSHLQIGSGKSFRVILFAGDLSIPPSAPFEILITEPMQPQH